MNQKYVVLEGLDFSGKSTLGKKLASQLGWKFVNEPYTGNEHAAEVKRMNNANYLPKHYEMMMIIAGRIDCFNEVVNEHRYTGLISDRNVISSMVYQSTVQFPPSAVLRANREMLRTAHHDLNPSHVLFMDIDHKTFLERLEGCQRAVDAKDLWLKDPKNWEEMREKYLHSLALFTFNTDIELMIIKPDTPEDLILEFINQK